MSANETTTRLILDGDPNGLVAAMNKARASVLDTESGILSIGRSMGAMAAGLGLSGAAVGALVKSSIDAADNLSKMSQKVGVNIEELSGMAYAAGLADVSTESLAKSMGKLNKGMFEAAGGKGPAETFQALSISVVDATGSLRKSDEVMFDIADRFAGMDDGARKTALAMEIFGKSGADMIPLLNGGAAGLREATAEAARFGLVLDREAGIRAEEFNDNLTRMKSKMSGVGMVLANELLPEISDLMDVFGKGGDIANGPFIQGLHSVPAEIRRMAMLADKAGGSLTSVGMLLYGPGSALGYKPSKERFEQMAKWNIMFEERYAENEKALQALANSEVGLDNGQPFKPNAGHAGPLGGNAGGSRRGKGGGASAGASVSGPALSILEARRAELEKIGLEMALDEFARRREGNVFTEPYLNSLGMMSDSQQTAFDQRSQQSGWAAQRADSERQAQMAASGFSAADDPLAQQVMQIQQEEEYWIQHWATLTDSEDEYERRRLTIQRHYDQQRMMATVAGTRERIAFEQASNSQRLGMIASAGVQMTNAVANSNKGMFMANKAFRLIEGGMELKAGIVKTFNSWPYPYNIGMATLHGVAGAMQLADLASSGYSGSSGSPGGNYGAGTPTSPVVTQPTEPTRSQGNVTIQIKMENVYGDQNQLAKWAEEQLAPIMRDATTRNVIFVPDVQK